MPIVKPSSPNPLDPETTSGSAATPIGSHSFPLNDDLDVGTRLRFTKYKRFFPNEDATEQTTSVITLPLPIAIPENYTMRLSDFDMGRWGNVDLLAMERGAKSLASKDIGQIFGEVAKIGESLINDNIRAYKEMGDVLALKALAVAPGIPDNLRNIVQYAGGAVLNPHTTILFDGVSLRTFTLSWRFAPRSQQESDAVLALVNDVKLRAHPEEMAKGYALDYPDTVYVEFFGDAASYLPKFYKSFVGDIRVSYGSGSGMALFSSGAPIEIELNITFKELSIITRDVLRGESTIR